MKLYGLVASLALPQYVVAMELIFQNCINYDGVNLYSRYIHVFVVEVIVL